MKEIIHDARAGICFKLLLLHRVALAG